MCLKTKLYSDTQLSESLTNMVKNLQNKNYMFNTQEHQFPKPDPLRSNNLKELVVIYLNAKQYFQENTVLQLLFFIFLQS